MSNVKTLKFYVYKLIPSIFYCQKNRSPDILELSPVTLLLAEVLLDKFIPKPPIP